MRNRLEAQREPEVTEETLYTITKQLTKEHKPQDVTIKDKSDNRFTSKELEQIN